VHAHKAGDKVVTIDEYAQWAAAVAKPGGLNSRFEVLAYLGLGLIGEAGEVADTVRGQIRDGALNEDRLVYELGDLVFHWACLCTELGRLPSDMLEQSQKNIEARLAARKAATASRHE
jgi:NTP pyrophosphatase (non-canonical NTP hydrolase)